MIKKIKKAAKKTLGNIYKNRAAEKISIPFLSSRLEAFFQSADLKVLDVGARGGPFAQLEMLAPFSYLFICEADPEEAKELEKKLLQNSHWRQTTIIPGALYSANKKAEFHIARPDGLSSLLELNKDELNKFHCISFWGNDNRRISVNTLTLDEAAKKYGFEDLSFIKLDTQGTELSILDSGKQIVLPSLVGVYLEAELIPIYKNQPLFGRIHNFLEAEGFRLIDLKRTLLRRRTHMRAPYSKRELAWVHALYFREKNKDGSVLTDKQMVKLACLATAFEYFDYAIWLLEKPAVQKYLAREGLIGVEEELAIYAGKFWSILKRRLQWLQKRQISGSMHNDREFER